MVLNYPSSNDDIIEEETTMKRKGEDIQETIITLIASDRGFSHLAFYLIETKASFSVSFFKQTSCEKQQLTD